MARTSGPSKYSARRPIAYASKFAVKLRTSGVGRFINTVVSSINRIEWVRKQLHDLMEVLEVKKSDSALLEAAKALDEKFVAVESRYFQPILAEGDLKSFRDPNRLYSQLAILAGDVGNGSADFPPTTQQIAVYEELQSELSAAQSELSKLIAEEIPAFNEMVNTSGIQKIVVNPTE